MTLVILMLLLVLFMVFGRSFSSECPVAPPQQTTTRVLHGERLAPFMDPTFFAHLQIRYYNGDVGSCSGSLIAPSLILTAAHCVKNAYPNGWNVYTNIRDNHPVENGTRRQVSDFHVHPLFKLHGNQAFDMAIVQTDSPFEDDNAFTRFPRPRENNARLEQLGICQLTGSGLTLDDDGNTCVASKIRRHTTGIIIASACCNDALRLAIPQPQPKNPFESVCLRNLTDMACSGDSGGPVICRSPFTGEYMLMGILRARPLCCSDKKPYHILNAPIERNILRLNGRRLSWVLHAIRLLHKPRTDEDNDSVPLEFRRNWTENPRHDDYM